MPLESFWIDLSLRQSNRNNILCITIGIQVYEAKEHFFRSAQPLLRLQL